jgi:hypothetical protein
MSAPPTHHLGTLAILPPKLREIIYENILRDVRTTYASSRSTTSPIPLLHVNRALRSLAISIIKRKPHRENLHAHIPPPPQIAALDLAAPHRTLAVVEYP